MCYIDQDAYDATVEFMKAHNINMPLPRWVSVEERQPNSINPRNYFPDYWVLDDGEVKYGWTLDGKIWHDAKKPSTILNNVTHWYEVLKPLPPKESIKTAQ